MKQWSFHLIYLSIIAFLSYQYWSSVQAFKTFEHLDRQLKTDSKIMDKAESVTFYSLETKSKAYPTAINLLFLAQSEIIVNAGNQAISFIDSNNLALNLDSITLSNFKTLSPNNSFFNNQKIDEIKNELMKFHNTLIHLITDVKDQKAIEDYLLSPKTITDETYWNRLKYLPLSGVSAELSALKNQIKIDKIVMLNFFDNKASSEFIICGPTFRTAISPKKASLIEGEIFEADIYLAKYESVPNNNLIIKVNGQPLAIKVGVAHFKSKHQTVGTKTIKAEVLIKNPLTGLTTTTEAVFEYQVLPKCSRDCTPSPQ